MLTDVFVPLLTYPDETDAAAFPKLVGFLQAFASNVTYCGVVIHVPETGLRWGARLVALPQMVAEVEQRSGSAASRLLQSAQEQPGSFNVEISTIKALFGDPGQAVAAHARNHDVTALLFRGGSAESQAIVEDVMFGSGRPLITIPEGGGPGSDLSRIAIAWDGSHNAARAVYDAMPLLAKAEQVFIVKVANEKPLPQGTSERLEAYLRRHNIEPVAADGHLGSHQIGAALQNAALENNAGLLVMGAYGHSRLREFVLGGATAGVLHELKLPIFFSR